MNLWWEVYQGGACAIDTCHCLLSKYVAYSTRKPQRPLQLLLDTTRYCTDPGSQGRSPLPPGPTDVPVWCIIPVPIVHAVAGGSIVGVSFSNDLEGFLTAQAGIIISGEFARIRSFSSGIASLWMNGVRWHLLGSLGRHTEPFDDDANQDVQHHRSAEEHVSNEIDGRPTARTNLKQ